MKGYKLLLLFFWIQKIALGQNTSQSAQMPAKLYIIGVVHTENTYRHADSLIQILQKIQPDLILLEADTVSGYFNKNYELITPPGWYKMARSIGLGKKMPPEMEAGYRYSSKNSLVQIMPYDIEIRNRKKYLSESNAAERNWMDALNKTAANNAIPSSLAELYAQYVHYNQYFFEQMQLSYRNINRAAVLDSTKKMISIEESLFPQLMDSVESLKGFKDWHTQQAAFWQKRNETMTDNIIQLIALKKANRVVVFTGYLHKYILTDLLKSHKASQSISLVDFY